MNNVLVTHHQANGESDEEYGLFWLKIGMRVIQA